MKILLIGCGNIGGALLNLWISNDIANEIVVVQPSLRNKNMCVSSKILFIKNIRDISSSFTEDLIVLAVKPQNLRDIVIDLNNRNNGAVIVSTIAGVSVGVLSDALPSYSQFIRIMPNIAIKNGHSVNLTYVPYGMSKRHLQLFYNAFGPSGKIFIVDEEKQIDLLTPIFGSGPAYFFLLANILLRETIKHGISEKNAERMIDLLFEGSAKLINHNQSYAELISSICSKKGVTEVALRCITEEMHSIIEQGLAAAIRRIDELNNENSN